METYAFGNDTFYRVEVDQSGTIVGAPVEVDASEAIRPLIDNYLNHTMVSAPLTNGGSVTREPVTEASFAGGVLVPVFNTVMDRNDLTFPEKMDLLHRAFGDNPAIVQMTAKYLGGDVASSIWGTKYGRYSQNSSGPAESVAVPANVVENGPSTQGTGPLFSPPNASIPDQNLCSPADDPGPQTAVSPQADPKTVGDPVILFTGQLYYQVNDLSVPGRGLAFSLSRTYLHQTRYKGPLGYSWDHSYNLWLREEQEIRPDGSLENVVYRSNGQVRDDRYVMVTEQVLSANDSLDSIADAVFAGPPGYFDQLIKASGTYTLALVSGVTVTYNANLQVSHIEDLNGNLMTFNYDANRLLVSVVDPVGKTFTFTYDQLNRLTRVRDDTGRREVRYTYGDNGDLVSVDLAPDGELIAETDYDYLGPDAGPIFEHNLIGVTNALGQRVLDIQYGTEESEWGFNRVIYQRSESGELEYDYQPIIDATDSPVDPDIDLINYPRLSAFVRDRRGHVTEHRFSQLGTVVERREKIVINGARQEARSLFRYNEDALLIESRFPDGSGETFRYGRAAYEDLNGGDSSAASPDDRALFGLLLKHAQFPKSGVGEHRAIVTDYTYAPSRKLDTRRGPYYAESVTLLEEPAQRVGTVRFSYDLCENLTGIQYPPATLPDGSLQPTPPQQFQYDIHGMLTEFRMGSISTRYEYFPDHLRSGFVMNRIDDAAAAALVTHFDVDATGRVTRITTPYGAIEESVWNGFDLEIERIRADPGKPRVAERFSYNRNRQLVGSVQEVMDDTGTSLADGPLVQRFDYDFYGRLTGFALGPVADPGARTVRRVLASDGTVAREWDPRGVETVVVRDEVGQKIAIHCAPNTGDESVQRYEYDLLGALTAIIDGNGGRSEFAYDPFGRCRLTRDPDGNEVRRTFDAAGRVLSQELHGRHPDTGVFMRWSQCDFEYDVLGRQITTHDHLFVPGNAGPDRILTTRSSFDPFGRLRISEDPKGNKTTAAYDGLGRMTRLVSPEGHVTEWLIDDNAHTVTTTTTYVGQDELGNSKTQVVRTVVKLDLRGMPIRQVDSLGNTTTVSYDSRDLEISRIDPTGVLTKVVRNVFGEVTSRADDAHGKNFLTRFHYDGNGNLVSLTDPMGQVTQWSYDSANRMREVLRGNSNASCRYDPAGHEIRRELEDGVAYIRTLSPAGRVLQESVDTSGYIAPVGFPAYRPAVASDATFAYSPSGQISRATNADYHVLFRHDSLGRLLSEESGGLASKASYDDAGNRTQLVYPNGRKISATVSAEGHLIKLRQTAKGRRYPGDAATPAALTLAEFERIGVSVTGASLAGVAITAFYDRGRRPIGLDWKSVGSGALIHQERRLYSSLGDCRFEQLADRRRILTVDSTSRLMSAKDFTGAQIVDVSTLSPPATPAALNSSGQQDENQLLVGVAGNPTWSIRYLLDGNGNRQSVTELGSPPVIYQRDAFDQYATVEGKHWFYDSAGRLIEAGPLAVRFDARGRLVGTAVGAQQNSFRYDALGRLRAVSLGGSTQELYYFSDQLLQISEAGIPTAHLAFTGRRLCQVAVAGKNYIPVSDLAGSVLGWIDDTGQLAGYRTYDPFGRVLQVQGIWPLSVGFRGYWFDEGSGMALLLARAYWPEHGRFLQRDPAEFVDGTNLYAYARNSPLRWSDIWGFNSTELDWGTVAASAAETAAFGIGVGILAGAGVAAGIISAPVLLVAGTTVMVGSGINAYLKRADQALQAGETDFSGRAALAAAGDAVGVSGIYEGVTGQDVVTRRQFGCQERSERLGQGIGSAAALVSGGRSYKFGTSIGNRAVAAGYINPYTVPSASRPSFYNPIIYGKYQTPAGLILESNLFSGLRAGGSRFLRTGSASEAYAATLENARGNFSHILRHFADNPGRANRGGNPQLHGTFLPEYRGRVVALLDNAFELATNPAQHTAIVQGQGTRVAVTVFADGGPNFGTALGNPAAVAPVGRFAQYPYGAAVDVYTTIFGQGNLKPVTMYPGFPTQ